MACTTPLQQHPAETDKKEDKNEESPPTPAFLLEMPSTTPTTPVSTTPVIPTQYPRRRTIAAAKVLFQVHNPADLMRLPIRTRVGGEEGQEKNEEENSLPQQQQLDSMFSQTAKMFALDVMWLLFLSVVACLFACGWIASSSSSRENHSSVKSNMPDPSEKHHYCGDIKVAMEVVVATKTFIVCDPEDVGKMFLCPKSWLSMLKSVFESKSFSQWRNEVCTEVHFPPGTNATGEEKTKRDERDDNTITRLHLGQLFDEWKAKRSAEKRDRMKTAICNDEITEGNEERADAQSGDYCYFYSPVEICKISITSMFLVLFFLKLASFLYPELYITRREGGVPFFFQIDSEQ